MFGARKRGVGQLRKKLEGIHAGRFVPLLKSMGFEPVLGQPSICWSGRNWWVLGGVYVATRRGIDEVTIIRDAKSGPIYKTTRRDAIMMIMRLLNLEPPDNWKPTRKVDPRLKNRLLQFRNWYMKLTTDALDREGPRLLKGRAPRDKINGVPTDRFNPGGAVGNGPNQDGGK